MQPTQMLSFMYILDYFLLQIYLQLSKYIHWIFYFQQLQSITYHFTAFTFTLHFSLSFIQKKKNLKPNFKDIKQSISNWIIQIFLKYQMNAEGKHPINLLLDRPKLIQLINKLLEDILAATIDLPKGNSKFHAKQVPAMSVRDYLSRISKYSHCSNSSYVMALIYIDRLQDSLEQFVINKYCIHKLLLASIVLAAKYNDDEFYKNIYYAKVGGISLQEMNMLENHFTSIIDYNFFVKPEDFNTYLQKLQAYDVIND